MDNLFSKIISTIRRSFIGPLICWRFYIVSAKEAIVMVSIDMGVSFLHRRLSGPFLGVDDMEPASNHFYKLVLHAMYMAWNLSKPAPATPRRMLAPAPFIMLMKPSFFMICMAQSMEPLYLTPPPEVIIILLLIVSMG